MDILWLIGFFLGIDFLCISSLAHITVVPASKNSTGHRTQYRFQYFVRDERGDYKTQEEAGDGGNARGSYAVEEPDGDLRIVQYTADLGGGFQAHIKVDHGGKSSSKLQKIDIPAEEMQKLIEANRKKTVKETVPEVDQLSKSYILGPPKKMSDIVMEQAAAIREIISKEIEAEKKREADEKRRNEKTEDKFEGIDTVDCPEEKSALKTDTSSPESLGNIEKEKTPIHHPEEGVEDKISSTQSPGKDLKEDSRISKGRKIEEKNAQILKKTGAIKEIVESPMVRVAMSPRKIDEVKNENLEKSGSNAGGPVQNFSFKNRLMFYKPAEKKMNQNQPEVVGEGDLEIVPELMNLGKKINDKSKPSVEQEEIILYSPYQDDEKQGERKNRFITVPYEVLRPYLAKMLENEENSK